MKQQSILTSTNAIERAVWLVDTIRQQPGVGMEDLITQWNQHSGQDIKTRQTFATDLRFLRERLSIDIQPKKQKGENRTGYYLIDASSLTNGRFGLMRQMLCNIMNVELLQEFHDLGPLIRPLDIPCGMEYLRPFAECIREHIYISVRYQKFVDTEEQERVIAPHVLKAFQGRWYVLAYEQDDASLKLKHYALDRIKSVTKLSDTFEPFPVFDPDKYYRDYYGIFCDESKKPQNIIIEANEFWTPYFRTLPLHHSQTEIAPRIFRLYMCVTPDFENDMRRYGDGVKWSVKDEKNK